MNSMSIEHVWKQILRWFCVALAVGVFIGTLYVVTTVGDEDTRLTIAVKQGAESVALKEIAQRFSRDRHVPVEVIDLPYDELYAEEQRQLVQRPARRRDSVPPFDVIMVDDPWLYAHVSDPRNPAARRLRMVNDILKGKENDFFPSTLRVSTYCRHAQYGCSDYYAVPFVANSQLFASRADIEKSGKPTTWKQVVDASMKIEKKGGIGYVTRIGPGNSIVTDFMPILWAYDPDSLPDLLTDGDALKHPEAAFSTMKTLVATRRKLGSASFDDFDVSAYLQKGCASMGIVWSAWALMLVDIDDSIAQDISRRSTSTISTIDCMAKLSASLPPNAENDTAPQKRERLSAPAFKEKLIFGNIPFGSSQESNRPELGVWLLAIPADSEQTDLALEFIKYATDLGDDAGAKQLECSRFAAQRGTPPPRLGVLAELQENPQFKNRHPSLMPAIAWSLEKGRERPRTACWKEIESRLGTYLEKLIDQNMKPAHITECAKQNVTPLFNEEKCETFLKSGDKPVPCPEQQ